jgi:hypothetical protein
MSNTIAGGLRRGQPGPLSSAALFPQVQLLTPLHGCTESRHHPTYGRNTRRGGWRVAREQRPSHCVRCAARRILPARIYRLHRLLRSAREL